MWTMKLVTVRILPAAAVVEPMGKNVPEFLEKGVVMAIETVLLAALMVLRVVVVLVVVSAITRPLFAAAAETTETMIAGVATKTAMKMMMKMAVVAITCLLFVAVSEATRTMIVVSAATTVMTLVMMAMVAVVAVSMGEAVGQETYRAATSLHVVQTVRSRLPAAYQQRWAADVLAAVAVATVMMILAFPNLRVFLRPVWMGAKSRKCLSPAYLHW